MDMAGLRNRGAGASRYLLLLALAAAALMFLAVPSLAEEIAPAAEAATATVESTGTVTEAVTESVSKIPGWADEIVSLLIKAFGAALIALAALAVRKLGKKWGIEHTESFERLARENVRAALNFSDRWARLQDEKPGKKAKLEKGLDRLIEIEKLVGITDIIRDSLARRIEAELEAEAKENGT